MQYPNIKYIITSQLFEKTKNYELTLAIPNDSKEECDAIIITKENGKNELNGSNIKFTKNSIIIDENKHNFSDLVIAFEDKKCYLILESTKKKLWHLPDIVISFLKMDLVNINYALTILDKEPHVIEITTRNTYGENQTINWKEKLILINDNPEKLVKFHYQESSDEKDVLDSSYFIKYKSKYYIKDCYLRKEDNRIGVYSDMKIDELNLKNNSCLLGFIDVK